jgi:glycine betaine transporter
MTEKKPGLVSLMNMRIFMPAAIPLVVIIILGFIYKDDMSEAVGEVLAWTLRNFGWFYTMGSTFLLAVTLWACFSKYGKIKLGGEDAKPEMSFFTWFGIALTSGIAIGICFFGVAEPMTHYLSPPIFSGIEGKSLIAGETALRYTYFHWTFHTYGCYTSISLAIALAFYNSKRPFKVSSGLYGLIGEKSSGTIGTVCDCLGLFAIVGGVCTSLGFGVLQIGGGFKYLWGFEVGPTFYAMIIGVLVLIYTFSSYTGLDKGITFISNWNMRLYIYCLIFLLIFGPTIHMLEALSTGIGDYFQNIIGMSLYAEPMYKSTWVGNWSDFYWAWWLSFAPIVGLFLIRLGYGRTVRQYVLVNLVAPSFFGMMWFAFFGSSAIYFDHFKGATIAQDIATYGNEVSIYALFNNLPLASLNKIIGILIVAISFITIAHSMTSTTAAMTTKGFGQSREDMEAPGMMKIFWGVLMGVAAWLALVAGGTKGLQTTSIICGLPILVMQIAMMIGIIRWVTRQKEFDLVSKYTVDNEPIPRSGKG